ncbi:MAG: hypothetical protein MZV70_59995 [Desulfobacterales bacterium]|nr:hypothetical protein [Desulfobacterales bacterium]
MSGVICKMAFKFLIHVARFPCWKNHTKARGKVKLSFDLPRAAPAHIVVESEQRLRAANKKTVINVNQCLKDLYF